MIDRFSGVILTNSFVRKHDIRYSESHQNLLNINIMPMSSSNQLNIESQSVSGTPKSVKEDKKSKTIVHILPKLPSSDSLSNSPGPASPGI